MKLSDLTYCQPVGYFAEAPETAAYETLARREALTLSIAALRIRSLLGCN